jgi:hypothetical protein
VWQIAALSIDPEASMAPARAVATPARNACSTNSHTAHQVAITAIGLQRRYAANPVGTGTSRVAP